MENEYANLSKGKLTALQFLPLFESTTSEMAIAGVGLSERQLLLGYLRKVGEAHRAEILKDRRLYPTADGSGEEMRAARSWMEAHHLLLEIESVSAGTKALINASFSSSPSGQAGRDASKKLTNAEKKAKKRASAALKAGAPFVNALIDPSKPVCFIARDQGTCTAGQSA